MKIISIGDIHGRPYWKEIDLSKYDKVIFNGDYVDSKFYSEPEIIENLREIVQLKLDNYDKVVLLLGNHDIQYIWNDPSFRCSGFNPVISLELHKMFNDNMHCFQMAYQIGNHIWTHAGISKGWYIYNKAVIDFISEKYKPENSRSIDGLLDVHEELNLADILNMISKTHYNEILHQVSDNRGGYLQYGGITWADRRETMNGYLPGYHQIVGHTAIRSIEKYGDENGSIRYIDVLAEISILREQIAYEIKVYGSSNRMEEEKLITKFYEFELNN